VGLQRETHPWVDVGVRAVGGVRVG
jgi:hypothetical protein